MSVLDRSRSIETLRAAKIRPHFLGRLHGEQELGNVAAQLEQHERDERRPQEEGTACTNLESTILTIQTHPSC